MKQKTVQFSVKITEHQHRMLRKIMALKSASDGFRRFRAKTFVEIAVEGMQKYINAGIVK